MQLPPGFVFGDYQLLYGLKTNFIAKAGVLMKSDNTEENCETMDVKSSVFNSLIELYPKTKEKLMQVARAKREVLIKYLLKHEKLNKFVNALKKLPE